MSNNSEIGLWVGVRCRNPNCLRDFQATEYGKPLAITVDPIEDGEEGAKKRVGDLCGKMNPILNTIAALHGAQTSTSGEVDAAIILQCCPYCGRFYIYVYSDYFITSEPMPELPE
jgi:hypothetical protein